MRAAVFTEFSGPIRVQSVPDLTPQSDAVVIDVKACGICRSDWHAWKGHDSEVRLPHVPGHELAGVVAAIGSEVRTWKVGDRVTVPFCCGCGRCEECGLGNTHICDSYTQPGFTQWGAFAEQVVIRYADVNLVALPESIDDVTAASLGCRFATSFRAVVMQARVSAGERVVVHGCGGVGLSAIMIAKAIGAEVIAVDIHAERLAAAKRLGASELIDATKDDVVAKILGMTGRGAEVSIDALGSHQTCWNSIACLGKRGRHVQVGLMLGHHADPPIPMGTVIAKELEIYGSHGLQVQAYGRMLRMVETGMLDPRLLVSDVVSLEDGATLLTQMDQFPNTGMTVLEM